MKIKTLSALNASKRFVVLSIAFVLFASLALSAFSKNAFAHEHYTFIIGEQMYMITIGSIAEPITVDNRTGVYLEVLKAREAASETSGEQPTDSDNHTQSATPVLGLDQTLKVELIAGKEKSIRDLTPIRGEPGRYASPFYPTIATTITYRIFGEIEGTPFDYEFFCTPAGHLKTEDDSSLTEISDGVIRTLKSGAYGCPVRKKDLGFPHSTPSYFELSQSIEKVNKATTQKEREEGKQDPPLPAIAIIISIVALGASSVALISKRK